MAPYGLDGVHKQLSKRGKNAKLFCRFRSISAIRGAFHEDRQWAETTNVQHANFEVKGSFLPIAAPIIKVCNVRLEATAA